MDEMLETTSSSDGMREYLIFKVDTIEFGLELDLVQEILKMQPIWPVPNTLPFCKGIVNIRGTIVPVIDMRVKLGFEEAEYHERTCIIVVKLGVELVGIIVDMVQEVMRIHQSELSPAPALSGERKGYTASIASVDGKIKQILDVNLVFGVEAEEL